MVVAICTKIICQSIRENLFRSSYDQGAIGQIALLTILKESFTQFIDRAYKPFHKMSVKNNDEVGILYLCREEDIHEIVILNPFLNKSIVKIKTLNLKYIVETHEVGHPFSEMIYDALKTFYSRFHN